MRAFECSVTPRGRELVLEQIVATGYSVRVRRRQTEIGLKEEWRLGPLFGGEWCDLWDNDKDQMLWHARFGSGFGSQGVLHDAFLKVSRESHDCRWIWPERWDKEAPSQPPSQRG